MAATLESQLQPLQQGFSGDSLSDHIALQEWVTQHGGRLDEHVQFSRDDKRGVHIQVKPEWTSGVPRSTCVVKTPLTLTMSYFDAIDYRPSTTGGRQENELLFCSRGVTFSRSFIDAVGPEETTAFFLMGQCLKGSEGFWYPYIRTLPRPDELTTPLYYDDNDLVWLNMTSLAAARERRLHVWKTNYERGFKALRESGFEDADRYSWNLYLWASTIIASRAFTAKVLAGVIPLRELSEEKISVLLPLIDATNHRPLAKVEWQAGDKSIGVVVMENVGPGQEVGNNYGPRNNEQLMMNYGFCIPDNPCEYRVVSLRAPPGSPLSMAKARYEAEFPDPATDETTKEDKYYVFSISYPHIDRTAPLEFSILSPDLLQAVSIIAANDRELETLEITRDGSRIPLQIYGNTRNLLASLNQILLELMTHIQKHRMSDPSSSSSPKNLKQLYAKMYRESQIQLSKTAVLFAHWTLNLARVRKSEYEKEGKERLLDSFLSSRVIPTEAFPAETVDRIRTRILDRQSLLTIINGKVHVEELYLFGELFGLLPVEMQWPVENCLRTMMSEASRAIILSTGSDGPSSSGQEEEGNGPHGMLSFAIFLCFLIAAHRKDDRLLSPRLNKWCRFLLETYPPPPRDVAWVLPDEEDEAFLEAVDQLVESHHQNQDSNNGVFSSITHLVADEEEDWWLSPNWLRWAWLVLDQEMVMNMVDDPLKYIVEQDNNKAGFSTRSFLYIPQD